MYRVYVRNLAARSVFSNPNDGEPSSPLVREDTAGEVTLSDIRASAEKILYTYLLPGSEREIVLPQSIVDRVTSSLEAQQRPNPDIFEEARDYVFQAMERDAFPGFLTAKAFGNLTPVNVGGISQSFRGILGRICSSLSRC
jgi:hypothetical protein